MNKKEKIKKIIAEAVAEHKAEQKTKKQAILESYLKKIIIETVEEELSNEENLNEISFKGIKKGLSAVGDKISNKISNKASSLKDKIKNKLKNTANSFKSGFDSLYQAFDEPSKEGYVASVVTNKLLNAMKRKKVVMIYYEGDETVKRGYRYIEPYVYGVNKAGNEVVRAWLIDINKVSKSYPPGKPNDKLTHIPGWRMFRVDRIKNVDDKITGRTFPKKNLAAKRPKYNPNDKDMVKIYYAVNIEE